MYLLDGHFVYSATDLNNYLECGHLVSLERSVARGTRPRPERDETVALIAAKGLLHEQEFLADIRANYDDVVEIVPQGYSRAALLQAEAETLAAMARGVSAIYQGTFFDGTFLGKSDFLLRVETPCANWPWSYEVADTKLALHEKPYFIVQLCHYSEHLHRLQGSAPKAMHVVLGNGMQKSFRYDDFSAYYRHLKASFLNVDTADSTYPYTVSHCAICHWSNACRERLERDDHLSLVAWMRRDQIEAFEAAGIETLAQLGRSPNREGLKGIGKTPFERLQRQAQLQLRGRESGDVEYELLKNASPGGFRALPAPAAGDVFFDMEGDPFFEIGVGLEYLFGLTCPDDEQTFHPFWGTDRAGEKAAFERCVDFIVERRRRYPAMHVYHYAPYEKTALRKLMLRHDTREEEVDELLRSEVLVDLYAVVRQAVVVSQPSYSIKKLEPLYGMVRTADLRKGDDSIVMFERWLHDPAEGQILERIERYNEEDCRSTWLLRDWLLQRRAEYMAAQGVVLEYYPLKKATDVCHDPADDECRKCVKRLRDARELAKISQDQKRLAARDDDAAGRLLGHLLSYHRREEKPVWWAIFDRYEKLDQLLEDKEAISELELAGEIAPFRLNVRDRTDVYTYRFPEQSHRLGEQPYDPYTKNPAGQIISIDEGANVLQLKRSGTFADAANVRALIPGGPVLAGAQKLALARLADAYLAGVLERDHPVSLDLLRAAFPRLRGRVPRGTIQPEKITVDAVHAVIGALDRSYLVVQGPPGTGKTYTGARVIVRLLREGQRIGVMANGHKAIHNMLHEIEDIARAGPLARIRGLHKHSSQNSDSPYVSKQPASGIVSSDDNEAAETGDFNLISGNSWLFARENMIGRLDYLFIDEAGQTSLADALAVSPSATNVVLLGDPMQLAQVSQGTHGENAGRSILGHLLGDRATVAEDRGILSNVSYRMQPDICAYISSTIYEGRLSADPKTAPNRVDSAGLSGSGLRYLPVAHAGNGSESSEETERIVFEIEHLLRGTFVRKNEARAALTERDILIVTPYNAQRKRIVAALKRAGHDIRVGTVDKFQGQEAPVVFYSMATSTGEDLPRNMEFLFEKNRFNVAISRAQCLSVLVCSPRLLDVRCNHAEQMALVNVICRYAEEAAQPRRTSSISAVCRTSGQLSKSDATIHLR